MSNFAERKPHAVLIVYPVEGHINPMFKLAKLLHLRGFHINFVNTKYNHKRLINSRGPNTLDGIPDFSFETNPKGLSPLEGDGDVSQYIPSLCESVRKNFLHPFRALLARLKNLDGLSHQCQQWLQAYHLLPHGKSKRDCVSRDNNILENSIGFNYA